MTTLNALIVLIASNLITVFCLAISNIFLARALSPAEYGVYSFIMSFLLWVEILLISGIPQGINRYTVSHRNDSLLILKAGNILTIFTSVFLFILLIIFSTALIPFFKLEAYRFIFIISFLDIFFYGFYFNYFQFQNGLFNFDKEFIIRLVYAVTKLLFVLILLYLFKSVLAGILSNILASVYGFLTGIYLFSKIKNKLNEKFENVKNILKTYKNRILIYSIPVTLFILVFSLITNMDLWIIKYFYKNEVLGFYACAKFVAMSFIFISYGFCSAIFPQFVKNFEDKRIELINHHIKQTLRIYIVVFLPAFVILIFHSGYLIKLIFGEKYLSSVYLLNILLVAYWFLSIYLFFSYLFFSKKENYYIPILVSSILVVSQIVLSKTLLTVYAEKGVALAVVLVGIIGTIIYLILINRKFKNIKQIFQKEMFISMAMSIILALILRIIWTEKIFFNLISTVCLLFTYAYISFLLKVISKEDIDRIKGVFIRHQLY